MINLMMIANTAKILPKKINGIVYPPWSYKNAPITGETVSPMPTYISMRAITFA
jgi:hypothetical protein